MHSRTAFQPVAPLSLFRVGRQRAASRTAPLPKRPRPAPSVPQTPTMTSSHFKFSSVDAIQWLQRPITVSGIVQRGFGRGSRDLGTPTANLPGSLLNDVQEANRDGVYFGFGRVPKYGHQVVKMVANIGRNITYGDVTDRVLEAYLMADIYDPDFYGEEMRLCIIGYMRPELKFNSVQQLIEHIQNDVKVAGAALDLPRSQVYRTHTSLID